MKHIILTGFMGVGKSTVGSLVAERLHLPLVDLDKVIEQAVGLPCDFYIRRFGIEAFRKWEKRLLGAHLREAPAVLVPGGGVVVDSDNRRVMLKQGIVVWLKAPQKILMERLRGIQRPLLTDVDRVDQIRKLLDERWPYYQQNHYAVETSFLTAEQVAEKVVKFLTPPFSPS